MYGGVRAEPSYSWRQYVIQVVTGILPFIVCIVMSTLFIEFDGNLIRKG
jgi:hypothetical protein